MKRSFTVVANAAMLCVVFLSGCGKGTSPTSSALSALGASGNGATATESAFGALNTDMQAADSLEHGPCGSTGIPIGIPNGCGFDAGSGSFVCGPDIGPDGLTRTRSYQFLDASGASQSGYDSLTTASIHFVSRIKGTVTRRGLVSAVDDNRDLTESGLAGTETTRIWNGVGNSAHHDSTIAANGETRSSSVLSTTQIANVVVPAPWHRDSWPLSGTISTHLVTSGGVDITSVITFNGTRYVPMAIADSTVTIDLARPPHGALGGLGAGGDGRGPGGPGHGPGGGPGGHGSGRHPGR